MVNRLIQPPPATTPKPGAPVARSTDGELLMRFRLHGDQQAFAEVVERHRAMIWGVCSRVLVRRADAEDAYQATLLILAKKAGSIRANDSAGGWLFRVAHNAALGALRRRKALREMSLDEAPLEPEAAFPDLEQKQLVVSLLEELRGMPAKYRTVLVLRYLEGQSRREIAAAMDATVATVAGHLVRGRRMLRSRLARRGVSLGLVLGALGGASVSHAGTIHAAPPAFGPALLTSGASATVTSLVNQGVRTMFYTSVLKPAAIGAAATVAAAALLLAPPAGVAGEYGEATLELGASLEGGGAQEGGADAPGRLVAEPAEADASRASGGGPEVNGKVTATFSAANAAELGKAFASQKARYAKLAAEDASQDYEMASFEELYWQHQHWLYRQDLLVDRMKALDRQSKELAKAVSQGSAPRSAYEANQTRVLENRAEIPLAKAKIAEHERLLKQAALREVAGQKKAAVDQAASAGRGRGRNSAGPSYLTPRQNRTSDLSKGVPLASGDTLLFEYRSDDNETPSFRRLTVDPTGKLDLGSGFGVIDAKGQILAKLEADIGKRFSEKHPGLAVKIGASNRESIALSSAFSAGTGTLSLDAHAKPSKGAIEAGERLVVQIVERVKNTEMLNQTITVDGDGDLALGAQWGRFQVTGKTLRETEQIIQQQVQTLAAKAWMMRERADGREPTGEARIEIAVQVTREIEPKPQANRSPYGGFGGNFGGGYGGGAEYGGGGYGGEFGGEAKPKSNQGFGVPAKERR